MFRANMIVTTPMKVKLNKFIPKHYIFIIGILNIRKPIIKLKTIKGK